MAPSPPDDTPSLLTASLKADESGSPAGLDSNCSSDNSAAADSGTHDPVPPLSASWREEPLSHNEQNKVQHILQACRDRNLDKLRTLAASEGGLVEDEIRRTACMR